MIPLRCFVVFVVAGVLGGAQACSPVPGWKPKSIPELVAAAPIVAKVKLTSVSGDINVQTAVADVKCVIKNTSGAPIAQQIKITGFGNPSLCRSPAQVGAELIAYLDQVDLKTTPPTYKLVYSDQLAGTSPANPSNVAAAKSAVRPGAATSRDTTC